MSEDVAANINLDRIYSEVGEFGLFQIITFALICIPNTVSAMYVVNYIFSANSMDYR